MKIKKKLKIVFFGTPDFVDPVLKKLRENFEVIEIIRKPKQFNSEAIEKFRSLNPDLFVVASYGQILPPNLFEIPKFGAINIHPSLLPKYRGPSPVQSAILSGDKKTGITFIKMDEEIDHGPIIEQFEEPILENDTFETLVKRLFEKSAERVTEVIKNFEKDQKVKPQDDSKAAYTKLLTKQDGYFDLSIINMDRMIRAFYPWPGVWTRSILNNKSSIIKFLPEKMIQVEGKKPMSYKDFINGYEKGQEFLKKFGLS